VRLLFASPSSHQAAGLHRCWVRGASPPSSRSAVRTRHTIPAGQFSGTHKGAVHCSENAGRRGGGMASMFHVRDTHTAPLPKTALFPFACRRADLDVDISNGGSLPQKLLLVACVMDDIERAGRCCCSCCRGREQDKKGRYPLAPKKQGKISFIASKDHDI